MEVKQTAIKCITAILCVIAICVTSVSGVNKICDAVKTTAQVNTNSMAASDLNDEDVQKDFLADENGVSNSDEFDAELNENSVVGSGNKNKSVSVIDKNNGGTDELQKQSKSKNLSTTAEIINYYNTAISKAVNGKVGFYKERYSDNEKIDKNIPSDVINNYVYKFIGVGEENFLRKTVEKGKWEGIPLINKSSLSTDDISSANCTVSGSNYEIVINLKGSKSSASKSNPVTPLNAPLDKCGISVGIDDKNEYDHKTAGIIYDAVANIFSGAKVAENYSNAVLRATINASNGQLISLKIEWNVNVEIDKIVVAKATASCISHVTYSNFKY